MPCYHPIVAYRSRAGRQENGKWKIVFTKREGYNDMPVTIPCGQCIGCRLEKSRQWAIRCVMEASLHQKNCFLTLTYNAENMPLDQSLQKKDMVLFIKKIRKKYGANIKFYLCGEYGSELGRPHYHVCMFNHDFSDKVAWRRSPAKAPGREQIILYRSESLEKIWTKGFSLIGELNFESAAYVARYCLKKINGEKAEEHYGNKTPEYTNMSRRPGIAKAWWDKYKNDVISTDKIITRGMEVKPPRYFDLLLEKENPKKMERIKYHRKSVVNKDDNTWERLKVKEIIANVNLSNLKRSIENVNT
nr:MAG: replication initiator protein [Microviridae sp.]